MFSSAILVIALTAALPSPAEQIHRVWFLGWLDGGNDFAYAEVVKEGKFVRGAVRVHSVSTTTAHDLCRLPREIALDMLGPELKRAFSDLDCGPQELVRKPVAPDRGRVPAPDGEAVIELQRDGSRRFLIRLIPSGSDFPRTVKIVYVGAGCTEPVAFWAPDGAAVVFQFRWEGVSTLEVVDYPRELARAYNASGLEAYQNEEYENASTLFLKSAHRDPDFADPLYNLACIHALLGERDRALSNLKKAIELGGRRFIRLARRDPDFKTLRTWADFQELFQK